MGYTQEVWKRKYKNRNKNKLRCTSRNCQKTNTRIVQITRSSTKPTPLTLWTSDWRPNLAAAMMSCPIEEWTSRSHVRAWKDLRSTDAFILGKHSCFIKCGALKYMCICNILYHKVSCHIICHIILYYAILYYIILYLLTLYYIILY